MVNSQKSITIGGVQISPGQRQTIDLPVAKLYTHTEMTMPIHVVCGKRPGPTLFVSSAIHGDELNGVEIIRRLLKRKDLSRIHGILILIPIVNSFGFIHRDRYLPDRRDLNRSFPGSERGSLAGRIADLLLTEVISQSTHGIDLHTGSNHRFNLPQIRGFLDDEETASLAEAFGAPVMINSRLRDGSLREAVAEKNIPILLYEGGEAFRFNEFAIKVGYLGVVKVMRGIGMLPPQKTSKVRNVFRATASRWVRSPVSGILSNVVNVGKSVKKGDCLAVVSDPFGENEEVIRSTFEGLVIARSELPLAYEGDALFHIATMDVDLPDDFNLESLVSGLNEDDFFPKTV
ncbi:MAG: succinylglutamate desuccinylase [Desulfuromonas sp.]|nr:MAG: succinylglutamate desuccinylase [Desulfuromonas sp.]